MNSRATISGGISRKPEIQQSRRASAVSIPISSSINIIPTPVQPPQPPPPPPRRNTNPNNSNSSSNTTNNTNYDSKRKNSTVTQSFLTNSSTSTTSSVLSSTGKTQSMIINSFMFIIYKQHHVFNTVQKSKYFHLWRREVIYLRDSMKTRSERTTALMLGGVDEFSLDNIEPTRKKTTKMGISLMRWILISMTSRNLTRAWRTWVEYVS